MYVVRTPCAVNVRASYFPILVAIAVLTVLLGFRVLTGAGLGLSFSARPDGTIPTGIVWNHPDTLSYASWAQQTRFGSPFNSDLYTTAPHPAAYFNAAFAALGLGARWLGAPVMGLLNVAGLVGAAITVVALYHIGLRLGLTPPAARWSVVFLVAVTSLSYVVKAVCLLLHVPPDPYFGADHIYVDAFGFTTFLLYPYHAFSVGWMCLVLWLAAIVEGKDHPPGRGQTWRLLLLGALTLALSVVHPYEGPMVVASYAAYALVAAVRQDKDRRRRLAITLTLLIPTLLGVAYSFWLSRQPVWDNFASLSMSHSYSRFAWIVGYGLTLPFALVGVAKSMSDPRIAKARWMAWWSLLLVFLLIVANVKFAKISNGGQVPLALMAGTGWAHLLERTATWKQGRWRRLGYVTASIVCSIVLLQSVLLMRDVLRRQPTHVIDMHLMQATAEIRKLSHTASPAVLCDINTGSLLPGMAGFRVYAGHWSLTPEFRLKAHKMMAAGLDSAVSIAIDAPSLTAFDNILDGSQADFVLLNSAAPALKWAVAHRTLRAVGNFGGWWLFTVQREPLITVPLAQ
jgi:hypothetical protein